jgi:hypothetical protein
VWLPAGLSVKDIEDDDERLAAACWAHEVRVTPTRHQAALVVVDVIRRDPFTDHPVLTPAVLDDVDTDGEHISSRNGWTAPLPDRATLQPVAPADFPTVHAARNGNDGSGPRTGKTPATTPVGSASDSEPSVTGFGGVDVSDYV